MIWFSFFTLQIFFIFLILSLGYWIANGVVATLGIRETFWIDRICIGALMTSALFGILGIVVIMFPWSMRDTFSKVALASISMLSIFIFLKNRFYTDIITSSRLEKIFLLGVVVISGVGLALALLPVKLPRQLIDGPYVAKHDYVGVRIQYMTGNLPTDNSLPHVASEYLLRDISFKKERPIMPGQEVSNRPILVSLILAPIRAAFSLPSPLPDGLPKFSYVGTSWPDFSFLMQDNIGYLFSLSIGILLNALIFIAIGACAVRASCKSTLLAISVVALMLSSPYFIFQTIFTWPKELAAFFLLYSFISYYSLKSPTLAGAFLAFGYLSHPYVSVFLLGFFIHAIYLYCQSDNSDRRNVVKQVIAFVASFGILVMPWFVWTKLILGIPADLVAQNFLQLGHGWVNFVWIRPVNLLNTILPIHLLRYPFDLSGLLINSAFTIPGAIGFIIYLFSLMYLVRDFSGAQRKRVFLIYLPSLLLIFIFSAQAIPALHGLQGPIALLLLAGVICMQKTLKTAWMSLLVSTQVVINVVLLCLYFNKLL